MKIKKWFQNYITFNLYAARLGQTLSVQKYLIGQRDTLAPEKYQLSYRQPVNIKSSMKLFHVTHFPDYFQNGKERHIKCKLPSNNTPG